MQRRVTIGEYEVSIQADRSDDPHRPGYVVRYSIIRTDGRPVRGALLQVQSYDLIDGTDYFVSVDAALDYGEEKARQDVATF
ncbi:hypothetical protein [Cupriavidus sp. H39]|uniref:hypothetical protein n=1 Tax=Cupriavidus sp. H39 TaxID=3401635 RepID=UPI003D0021D3